jgi:hypothetical protein
MTSSELTASPSSVCNSPLNWIQTCVGIGFTLAKRSGNEETISTWANELGIVSNAMNPMKIETISLRMQIV